MNAVASRRHAALRDVRAGQGWGITLIAVVDLGAVGGGKTLHVLADEEPLCGVRGEVHDTIRECDARAEIVARKPVCVNCRDLLGEVPAPRRLIDEEAERRD